MEDSEKQEMEWKITDMDNTQKAVSVSDNYLHDKFSSSPLDRLV